jgi:tetratricopeptide (TPR) repeat protein
MDCPVCPRTELPPDKRECPSCGVDLTPVRRIRELADRFYNEGLALAQKGDCDQALEKLVSALQAGCESARTRVLIGKLHMRIGRPQDAIAQWLRALDVDPGNQEAQHLIATSQKTLSRDRLLRNAVRLAQYSLVLAVVAAMLLSAHHWRSVGERRVAEARLLRVQLGQALSQQRAKHIHDNILEPLVQTLRSQDGLTVRSEPGGISVVFSDGLFASGSSRLTRKGILLLGG